MGAATVDWPAPLPETEGSGYLWSVAGPDTGIFAPADTDVITDILLAGVRE
jgi:hypothetical protein